MNALAFHLLGWDTPLCGVKIEFCLLCSAQLSGADKGERSETQCTLLLAGAIIGGMEMPVKHLTEGFLVSVGMSS